jgi:hypothetical protein
LQREHVAALAFRLLLGVLGAVMLGEVVADDAIVVSALADLLLAVGANANEAAPEQLDGDVGRRASFAHRGLLSLTKVALRRGWPSTVSERGWRIPPDSANTLDGDVDQLYARRLFRELGNHSRNQLFEVVRGAMPP